MRLLHPRPAEIESLHPAPRAGATAGAHPSAGATAGVPCLVPKAWGRTSRLHREAGVTLVELIVTVAILSILASAAIPITRFEKKRERERELRYDLWTMRAAIDRYKDAADKNAFQTKVDSQGYPPDLNTLVEGVDVQGKKVRFLRRVPVDPMTGKDDWGMHSMQDDPDSTSFGGQNLFDVYSKSDGTALDGSKYSTWSARRWQPKSRTHPAPSAPRLPPPARPASRSSSS